MKGDRGWKSKGKLGCSVQKLAKKRFFFKKFDKEIVYKDLAKTLTIKDECMRNDR